MELEKNLRFVWKPEYSVGVKMFDEQHQHFFELANRIDELSSQENVGQEELLVAVTEFGNYSLYHLSSEEDQFKKYGYKNGKAHIQAHDVYRKKIRGLLNDVKEAKSDVKILSITLADFAVEWLVGHILSVDKEYTAFFNEHELY